MKIPFTVAAVLIAAVWSSPVMAQQKPDSVTVDTVARPPAKPLSLSEQIRQDQQRRPEDQMSTSGFFLGIVGMLAGAAVGSQIGQQDCPTRQVDRDCVGRHAYTGALVAGTLMVPIGVHLGSKSHGNLLASLGMSMVTGAIFYYGFKAVPGSPIAMAPFLAAPIQVITSVKLERRKQ